MKNLIFVLFICFAVIATSCQSGGGDNNQQQPQQPVYNSGTTVPINNDCVNNPSSCQGNVYNQGYGFYPYNYSGTNNGYPYTYSGFYYTNNSAYLCNCPSGMIPTYNNYGGLGCVNSSYAYGYGYAYFGWGGTYAGATNNQWVNIPQVSNYTGYNQANNCYNGVVQSCLVDQPSTCSSGYTCRSTSAQSRLGLCVSNNAQGTGQYGGGYR